MNTALSLVKYLQQTNNKLYFFDMGRRVQPLSPTIITQIENQQIPYPYPYLHHAWLSILVVQNKQLESNIVWFLKLPLDEQGLLISAVRDDLLTRLISSEPEQDSLKDNPFSFTPEQDKMAVFHAYSTQILKQPASEYYIAVKDYIAGNQPADQWLSLGYQGIADFIIRQQQEDNQQLLINAISWLPEPVFLSICSCIESIHPSGELMGKLCQRTKKAVQHNTKEPQAIVAMIRGISNGEESNSKQAVLTQILNSPYAQNIDVIVSIGSRCISSLYVPELLSLFLEKLAASEADQVGFSKVLADLMFIPTLRKLIMLQFGNNRNSAQLNKAIEQMFGTNFK